MKIRLRETRMGSPNGIAVFTYEQGLEIRVTESPDPDGSWLSQDLAGVFVREGWAEVIPDQAELPMVEAPTRRGRS